MPARVLALLENQESASVVSSCLDEAGHNVSITSNYREAKSILTAHHFDLIISDVHLQNGGSVFEFLKWVSQNTKVRDINFVLFSLAPTELAKSMAKEVQLAAQILGASKYLVMESFDSQLFLEEIEAVLQSTCRPAYMRR